MKLFHFSATTVVTFFSIVSAIIRAEDTAIVDNATAAKEKAVAGQSTHQPADHAPQHNQYAERSAMEMKQHESVQKPHGQLPLDHTHDVKHGKTQLRAFHETAMSRRLAHNSAQKRAHAVFKHAGDFAQQIQEGADAQLQTEGSSVDRKSNLRTGKSAAAGAEGAAAGAVHVENHYFDGVDTTGDDDFQFANAQPDNWLFTDYRMRTDCSGPVARRVGENYICFNLPMNFGVSDRTADDFSFYSAASYYYIDDSVMISTNAIVADSLAAPEDGSETTIDTKRLYYSGKRCQARQQLGQVPTQHNERCEWGIQKRSSKNRVIPYLDMPGVVEMVFPTPFSCFRFISNYILTSTIQPVVGGGGEGGGGDIIPLAKQRQQQQQQHLAHHARMKEVLKQHPAMAEFEAHAREAAKDPQVLSNLHDSSIGIQDVRFATRLNPGPITFSVDYYNVCVFDEVEKLYSSFVCEASSYSCVESFFSDPLCRQFQFSQNMNFANHSQLCGYQGMVLGAVPVTNQVLRLLVDENGDLITDDGLFPTNDDISIAFP